jgi:hypothetical protein
MLEDLDTVDIAMPGEPGEYIIKIIDGAVTTDPVEFDRLLKAKIALAVHSLDDEESFESAGRPTRLRIEVLHFIPRPPYLDDVVYTVGQRGDVGRLQNVTLTFVLRESRYNMPWME